MELRGSGSNTLLALGLVNVMHENECFTSYSFNISDSSSMKSIHLIRHLRIKTVTDTAIELRLKSS